MFVSHPKHRVREPAPEGFVVLELLEELGVVFEEGCDDSLEGFIVFDLGVLAVRVLLSILILRIGCHLHGYLARDALLHPFRIGEETTELVVERLHDVREPIQLRLGFSPSA